jgi:nitrate reductase gamma subunit
VKALIFSLVLLVAGAACILLENTLYQYVGSDGVLHESLFLPLGVISVLLAGIGLVFVLAKALMSMRNRKL